MKKIVCSTGLLATLAFIFTFAIPRNTMKLVHKTTGFVIAEQTGSSVTIKDPLLLMELTMKGVSIPPFKRALFDGKSEVHLNDPLFTIAFKEVYLKLYRNEDLYEWKE
ncbi:MAG: hypothetical protein WCG14_06380 [Chlamydiia bacterium]